ncbi:hypothetical protein F5876DRAFT_78908 [Lentinula aff. lateritia]|uniref:Uncharacterized protein n=1 Tax=Lentinula aff. lateritia TaxID=2804960 RepID=A0ACC1TU28_9AGAR|nr:hypothetical protein F5876DRAFT_78908 [Lentinula aff. lateritia]
MVAIHDPTAFGTTFLSPQLSPSPSSTPQMQNSLHSFNIRSLIIPSAAGLGIVIAFAAFAFIFYKRFYSSSGSRRVFLVSQVGAIYVKSDGGDKYSNLKPLKLLSAKNHFSWEEKHAIHTNINMIAHVNRSSWVQGIFEIHHAQANTHSLPSIPPGSFRSNRSYRSRQLNAKKPPSMSLTTLPVISPNLNPSLPLPACIFNEIPVLCSPPSTSPKEIFEWIQSDSVLNSHDGYVRAREDSRIRIFPPFPESGTPTSILTQQAHISSILSSSTMNRTYGVREQSLPRSLHSSLCEDPSPTNPRGQTSSKSKGATHVPSVEHLFKEECDLGPLQQGTRWGSISYTLDMPISKRKDTKTSQKSTKAGKGGKENKGSIALAR